MGVIGLVVRDARVDAVGGDLVQARAVGRFVREAGATVRYVDGSNWDGRGWDAAVLFNVALPETMLAAERCARLGLPYVVFPVFWDLAASIPLEERRRLSRCLPMASVQRRAVGRLAYLCGRGRGWGISDLLRMASRTDRVAMMRVLGAARGVCPNSTAEAKHLAAYLGVEEDERWVVVRNGLWAEEIPRGVPWGERAEEVVCLGALSPRKNSFGLVAAAGKAGVRLRIVGQDMRAPDAYARRVMALAGPNVVVEGARSRGEALSLLARSRAHAQVGFVETPGLATLEAAAAGASIVAAGTPVVKEYFPDGISSVDPTSVQSIASALVEAVSNPPCGGLAELVRTLYDWGTVLQPLRSVLAL